MKKILQLATCIALIGMLPGAPATLAKKKGDGFFSLYNGKDLKGWKTPTGEHAWKVVDGVIDYEAKGGNLTTEKSFEDYILRIDWRFKRTAGPPYNAKLFDAEGNV